MLFLLKEILLKVFIEVCAIVTFFLMIKVRIREVAEKFNIRKAYQLQVFTGFPPSQADRIWKGEWKKADLKTLNTLCNLFGCTPNDLLEFTPDPEEN